MLKLAAFDLDGTLAELGRGIAPEDLALLHRLEEAGVRIAVCSGKPTYYLCGMLRQVGLKAPILVGENGAVIQFGVDLPPRQYRVLPYSDAARESIRFLRQELDRLLPGMWYQPNEVGLTPFPKSPEEFGIIEDCLARCGDRLRDVEVYRHCDSFDIVPKGIDKAAGLEALAQWLGIDREEAAAIGDGANDYPMFDWAGLALGIRVRDADRVDRNFETITQALVYLLEQRGQIVTFLCRAMAEE